MRDEQGIGVGVPVSDVDLAEQLARDSHGGCRSWAPTPKDGRSRRAHGSAPPAGHQATGDHEATRTLRPSSTKSPCTCPEATSRTRRPKCSMSPASLWRRHSKPPSVESPPGVVSHSRPSPKGRADSCTSRPAPPALSDVEAVGLPVRQRDRHGVPHHARPSLQPAPSPVSRSAGSPRRGPWRPRRRFRCRCHRSTTQRASPRGDMTNSSTPTRCSVTALAPLSRGASSTAGSSHPRHRRRRGDQGRSPTRKGNRPTETETGRASQSVVAHIRHATGRAQCEGGIRVHPDSAGTTSDEDGVQGGHETKQRWRRPVPRSARRCWR